MEYGLFPHTAFLELKTKRNKRLTFQDAVRKIFEILEGIMFTGTGIHILEYTIFS